MEGTEWVAPTITGALALVVGVVAGAMAIRNTRTGAREQRAPSVTDAWATAERISAAWYELRDLFYAVRDGWKSYARRTQGGGDTALTEEEKAVLQTKPPIIEKEKT